MKKTVFGVLISAILAVSAGLSPVAAKPFRWANDGDVNSMDPYARNETFLLTFMLNVYEPLVRRDASLKLEPALATEWKQTAPTVWRFALRHGVKFHDGSPFSADDVVFSFKRVTSGGSNLKGNFATAKDIRKIDDFTVEFDTDGVDPIFPDQLTVWGIMSKAWAEKNNAVVAADITKNEESFATRNANGTGPFVLKLREPDVKTVLVPNPNWWDKAKHDITEATFFRIGNDATRVAALLSGEVDFVYTVPPQDHDRLSRTPGLKIVQGPELRVIYLSFDQLRDELTDSPLKGKNPFKDKRVRQAFYQAIDVEAIKTRVMRNQSVPIGSLIGPGVNGYVPEIGKRAAPFDPEAARKLLAAAGYPQGFEVTLDCPNDRYVNDEAICTAVVGMLARIGMKVNLNAQTRARFFAKVNAPGFNTSFYLLGWTPATYDAHNVLISLMHSRDNARSRGQFNNGGYANPEVDKLTDLVAKEIDKTKRQEYITKAFKLLADDFGYIPLHQQTIVWAMKQNIDVVQTPDNYFFLRNVNIK
ncbi:MAG: ABC transporter substrate-binding protein [Alphaproteobacteria bacterium]|nr:ABC transporter substrate-binding protein [Alphaproteobacteria bacterium]